jgi:hypothetical protein
LFSLLLCAAGVETDEFVGIPAPTQEIDDTRSAKPPKPAAKRSRRIVSKRPHAVSQFYPDSLADLVDRIPVKAAAAAPTPYERVIPVLEAVPCRVVLPVGHLPEQCRIRRTVIGTTHRRNPYVRKEL